MLSRFIVGNFFVGKWSATMCSFTFTAANLPNSETTNQRQIQF